MQPGVHAQLSPEASGVQGSHQLMRSTRRSYSRSPVKGKYRTGTLSTRIHRHVSASLALAFSVCALVSFCHTYGRKTRPFLFNEGFVEARLFDKIAISESRIRATRQGVRQQQYYPLADNHCSRSLGEVKLVLWNKRHRVCYDRDFARIFQKTKYFQGVNLLVCDQDCVHSPRHVFTLAKSRSIENAANRTVTLLPLNVGRHFKHVLTALRDRVSYEKKLPIAMWRGVTTGLCWDSPVNEKIPAERSECARRNLVVTWAGKGFGNIDVGLTQIVQLSEDMASKYGSLAKREMSIHDMLRYRYIISVEGNDVATNLKWALTSNSVVLMPPPTRESIILESTLHPWIHYVPLLHDLSDLQEKIAFCDINPLTCQNISLAATKFMLPFSTRSDIFLLGGHILETFVTEMKSMGVF